jgi:hypothetical protein
VGYIGKTKSKMAKGKLEKVVLLEIEKVIKSNDEKYDKFNNEEKVLIISILLVVEENDSNVKIVENSFYNHQE